MLISSICNDAEFCQPLPRNEIVVMEDREPVQEEIKRVMEQEFGFSIRIAENEDQAVVLADEQDFPCCLFDVHMGKDRQQEGINALERIKDLNKPSFVAILTGHPSSKIQHMANKMGADLYKEKSTSDPQNVIREIALQIKSRKRELLQEKLRIIDEFRNEIIEELEKQDYSHSTPRQDFNIAAYENLKLDEEWLAEYKGKYVAFIDGKLIGSNADEQKLLEKLKTLEKQDKPIFFTKVEENPRIVDLPSSLWFD